MKKSYDIAVNTIASIEKVDGKYDVVIYYNGNRYSYRFSDKAKALEEILSYAEMDNEDFDLAVAGGSGIAFDFR